jgi:hypothetical protein
VKAYSLSTPEGDVLMDYEDDHYLFAAVSEGAGIRVAMTVDAAVNGDDEAVLEATKAMLLSSYNVVLTVHDESEDEDDE